MVTREIYNKKIENALKLLPIIILTGARQVGKTTIMQNYEYDKDTLFLNGQNPEIIERFAKYSTIENYLKINLNKQLNGYLLIDEFQFITGISTILKLLTDNNSNLKIVATGSSSLDMAQKVEESLAGRVRIINVYSLSFPELIKFYDEQLYKIYMQYDQFTKAAVVEKEIEILEQTFLTFGGLPRVALTNDPKEKIELLNDIYQTYLLHDVKTYVKNEDSVGFNKMLRLLSAQTSNLLNVNQLSNSSGLSYKKTVEYLYLLEQMFIIKLIEPYHVNKTKTIKKMKKVYFYDLGIRNVIYNSFNDINIRVDNGALFENYVFLELLKYAHPASSIYFYRTRDGAEIDFVVDDMIEKITLEAKYKHFDKPITFKHLNNFNQSENILKSYLVNRNLNRNINKTHFIPAYLLAKIYE